tara:strand:+ start:125 stop:625 length:501 start_codon:yes stop_codon:yes gene_type:complete
VYPLYLFGGGLLFLGELIRIYAVSYAGGITRTTKVGAPSLCTSGPYALTRNPLYFGNMIIFSGVTIITGGIYVWEMFLFVFIFFTFQYGMIIALEEETLVNLFGEDYYNYKNNVPRLFPRLQPWKSSDNRSPTPIIKTLKTEKRTLQNIVLILCSIIARDYFGAFS